jgi:hypothetical protein
VTQSLTVGTPISHRVCVQLTSQNNWALACGPLSHAEYEAATAVSPATLSMQEPLVPCDVQLTGHVEDGIFVYMGNDSKRLYQASRLDGDAMVHQGIVSERHEQKQDWLSTHAELLSQLRVDAGSESANVGLTPIGQTIAGGYSRCVVHNIGSARLMVCMMCVILCGV